MNLAERYLRGFVWENGVIRTSWIEGKAVHGLQTAFLLDWYFVDNYLNHFFTLFPTYRVLWNSMAQVVTSDPIGPWKDYARACDGYIASSKYFYIQTPYFFCLQNPFGCLANSGIVGVDVRLMLPALADNRITHLGSFIFERCDERESRVILQRVPTFQINGCR